MANVAACTLGAIRWEEQVARRWAPKEIDALIEAQFAASEQLARARIRALPNGEFFAAVDMDDTGLPGTPPLHMSVRVVIDEDRILVDLSGLPPQVEAPINAGATGGARSSVRVALKALLAPERPSDHGFFNPVEIIIPPRTVLSAENAPMGFWNLLPPTLIDLILRAIGDGAPDRVPAGHFAALTIMHLSGRDEHGEWWLMQSRSHGGLGASSDGETDLGPSCLCTTAITRGSPTRSSRLASRWRS